MGSSVGEFSLIELLSQANANLVVNKAIYMTFPRATNNSWKTIQPKKTKDSTPIWMKQLAMSMLLTVTWVT